MVAARVTSYLYSLRTAVFRPEDDELGQLVVGVSCRVIKPACPPDNGVAVRRTCCRKYLHLLESSDKSQDVPVHRPHPHRDGGPQPLAVRAAAAAPQPERPPGPRHHVRGKMMLIVMD